MFLHHINKNNVTNLLCKSNIGIKYYGQMRRLDTKIISFDAFEQFRMITHTRQFDTEQYNTKLSERLVFDACLANNMVYNRLIFPIVFFECEPMESYFLVQILISLTF